MGKLAINEGTPVRTRSYPKWPVFDESDAQAVYEVVLSGKWGCTAGHRVADFAKRFATFQEARYGICVTNGTTALVLALQAAGIGPGDEVIVPSYTFIASASAVLTANAVPVFVDIDAATYTLDPEQIEAAITERTRAIMPVHLGGCPAAMDRINAIAQKHDLVVIEDAAQAHGAEWKGRRVGAIGHLGCFSFQSSKNLNSGEGGIILTNHQDLAKKARSLSNCGRVEDGLWYGHYYLAGNHRMTELQGALLASQMRRFEEQTARRNENGLYLSRQLAQIPGIEPLQRGPEVTRHAYHLYIFKYQTEAFQGVGRDHFLKALQAEGIPAYSGYSIPLYQQPVLAERRFVQVAGRTIDYQGCCCPVTERACQEEAVWLTQRVLLGRKEDMDDIVTAVDKVQKHANELVGVAVTN